MCLPVLSVYFTVKSKYEFKVSRLVVHMRQCTLTQGYLVTVLTSDQSCINWNCCRISAETICL